MAFDINDLMSKDKKTIRNIDKPEKKQGRPKKEVTKKNIVTTYLTDEENQKFRNLVDETGLTVAEYLRRLIAKEI